MFVSSQLAKYDLYTDITFISNLYNCYYLEDKAVKVFLCAAVVCAFNVFLSISYAFYGYVEYRKH